MNWNFVVLILIYFRTASILFDLKKFKPEPALRTLDWKDSLFTSIKFTLSQIYVVYVSIKYVLRTKDYGLRTTDYGLRTTDYGLRTTDYGLRTTDYGLRTTDYGLRTTDWV